MKHAICFISVYSLLLVAGDGVAQSPLTSFNSLRTEYERDIRPLMKTYCLDCHSTELQEGELDLERFADLETIRRDPLSWQGVSQMLTAGEMPPRESKQPSAQQKRQLTDWVRRYLDAEARASAGDPGPVVLRRLNNAEYTYTLQDLTGTRLEPTREFPVDNAAGEGFTNTGAALVMSPGMVQKYLDAAQKTAEHAVLLPSGFRFSDSPLRRDWTNEILGEIRAIYAQHTGELGDANLLNRWNVADPKRITAEDGRVDLKVYFAALIRHRERLVRDPASATEIASQEKINAKYFRHLTDLLVANESSLLVNQVRTRLLAADAPEEGAAIASEVRAWQDQLFKQNTVGHFGSIRPWLAPVDPAPESARLSYPMPADLKSDNITLWLVSQNAAREPTEQLALWRQPRLEFKDRPPILLRDVRRLVQQVTRDQREELARTAEYLAGVAALRTAKDSLADVAASRKLDAELLKQWAAYLNVGVAADRSITGHLTNKIEKVDGKADINGWGTGATPCLFANRSDQAISFSTLTVPARGVTIHPSPAQHAGIAWQSPLAAKLRVRGKVADADNKCGNGFAWSLELKNAGGHAVLAKGDVDNGRDATFALDSSLAVQTGDVVSLIIHARNRDHTCDTTHLELTVVEDKVDGRTWDLARDVVPDIHAGNPHADSYGNLEVWHFFAQSVDAKPPVAAPLPPLPPGSSLAAWKQAVQGGTPREELAKLEATIAGQLTTANAELAEADRAARALALSWDGPLKWTARAAKRLSDSAKQPDQQDETASQFGLDPELFGNVPDGTIDRADLALSTARPLAIRLPAALARGGEFVVEGTLAPGTAEVGGIQFQVVAGAEPPKPSASLLGALIVTQPNTAARRELLEAYADFRELFPAAMCYARIVPVDEVVTLVLFHREDEPLMRLMLSDDEQATLNRLWDELRYVSGDALISETALEQILAFATQDGDPRIFQPLREPFRQNAVRYHDWLKETDPRHLAALHDFAAKAFRRPLAQRETESLNAFYAMLRAEEHPHEEAFRLTLARVLTSPAFLYRLEEPVEGKSPGRVNDWALAVRLSYFLSSTLPDDELRIAAAAGHLQQDDVLRTQTRRLLADDRTRRLAIEFACQWTHLRDFDQLAEKSERHFHSFARLQGDMYEESIRFFTDIFQHDRSILSILDAEHTFLNERLAAHYGVPGVKGESWQRVEGVRKFGRGGLLTQATFLSKQSGASRTSPILRGNWVSETLLGERLPRPPKDVPVLPEDVPANLTERALIERHSSDGACAKCHARIDPFGFALENYDAIGRFRTRDAGDHPIDTKTQLLDGSKLEGVDGLREYLVNTRRDVFVRQFCRKLLGYALGRAVQLSDEPLLDEMLEKLAANDYRFSVAVEAVVLSDQFRNIRGREQTSEVRVTPVDE